jgi:3-(3-hydroxy-phenyl)propionate hydroxylase
MRVDCDVLVVGLGPTGDVLAGLLALRGIRVIALDREPQPYPLPRAAVFDDEIMRIFQGLGVADHLVPLCRTPDRYEFVSADGDTLLEFPIKGEATVSGWEPSYLLHQPAVERALRRRAVDLGVEVRLGHRFVSLSQSTNQVVAVIDGPDGTYELKARYLVGCDGAGSAVRAATGSGLFDYEFDEPWLVIDALVPESAAAPDRVVQICDPARPSTYLKMTGERVRWEFMILPGESAEDVSDPAFIKSLLAPWNLGDDIQFERKAVYRFHGLVADRWREGRVLLAGDAAHQMPPFAGQGMCSGVRDAGNLAWKLASVLRGEADDRLLESYQAEREPHVRAIIETAIAMGKIICLTDPEAAAARNAGMRAQRAAGASDISIKYPDLNGGCLDKSSGAGSLFPQFPVGGRLSDELFGTGYSLIGRRLNIDPAEVPVVRVFNLEDKSLQTIAPAIDAWLVSHGANAVLVRPDRHVFGSGDACNLIDRLSKLAGIRTSLEVTGALSNPA